MSKFLFCKANAKLVKLQNLTGKRVMSFSTMSGYACPFAHNCLSKVKVANGKATLQDGPNTLYRCFSASQEVLFPNVRKHRQHNLEVLREYCNDASKLAAKLMEDLPKQAEIVRWHVAGDIVNQNHFDALIEVAIFRPQIQFYAYTKSLPYWVKRLGQIPQNLILTASYGGSRDNLIAEFNLRSAVVIADFADPPRSRYRLLNQHCALDTVTNQRILIDHNDMKAFSNGPSFGLLVHASQPKGSDASRSWQKIKGTIGGYAKSVDNPA